MNPLVTIAIPTYARLPYLRQAVESALAQDYQPIEIVIGNDGDVPELHEWCFEQAKADPRIRYQKNEKNLGLAGNWNRLADSARGEFIIIIGDDDRLLPEFVAKTVGLMRPHVSLVFTNHYVIDESGDRLESEAKRFTTEYGRSDLEAGIVPDAEKYAWRNSIPISAALMRTADVRRLRFKEDLNNPELELFLRLAREGAKFAFVPEYLGEYRVHSQTETTSTGLKSDHLVDYLLDTPVRPDLEPYKATYLRSIMVNAVTRRLVAGDRSRARRFLNSSYYPVALRGGITWLLQVACAYIPIVGPSVYQAVARIRGSIQKSHK